MINKNIYKIKEWIESGKSQFEVVFKDGEHVKQVLRLKDNRIFTINEHIGNIRIAAFHLNLIHVYIFLPQTEKHEDDFKTVQLRLGKIEINEIKITGEIDESKFIFSQFV